MLDYFSLKARCVPQRVLNFFPFNFKNNEIWTKTVVFKINKSLAKMLNILSLTLGPLKFMFL